MGDAIRGVHRFLSAALAKTAGQSSAMGSPEMLAVNGY